MYKKQKCLFVLHICTKSHHFVLCAFYCMAPWTDGRKGNAVAESLIDPLGVSLRFGFLEPSLCHEWS